MIKILIITIRNRSLFGTQEIVKIYSIDLSWWSFNICTPSMYQISRCRGSQYCCRITWIVDHTLINIYAFSFYPDGKIVADTIVSGFAVKTVFRRTTIMSFGETFINVPAFNNTITCVSIRTSAVKALISIDTISICVTVMKFQVTFVFGRVENRIIARLPEKTKVYYVGNVILVLIF